MLKIAKDISKDPRYYQIGFQGSFLFFGILILGWETEWQRVATYMAVCLTTQMLICYLRKESFHALKSALITSLGLGLLLHSQQLWVAALAAFIAIISKSILRFNGKHVFNPANLGIVLIVLLSNQAWISPGQWGSSNYFPFAIMLAGLIILSKVDRLETGFIFFGVLMLLEFLRQYVYLGWPIDFWLHRISNGSILVYALFMITDPKTTPNHKNARIIWSIILALITFILGYKMQLYAAPIYALFILSPFTPFFDKAFIASKFDWQIGSRNKKLKLAQK